MGSSAKSLNQAVAALEVLVDSLGGTPPLRSVLVFLKVAQKQAQAPNEMPNMGEIGEELGIPSDLMSRDVGFLSKFSRSEKGGGLEVIDAVIDLRDRRRRRLRLTPKGQKIIDELKRSTPTDRGPSRSGRRRTGSRVGSNR